MTAVRDLFSGEPSLVPGALRGYRTWRGVDPEGRLISTGILHRWTLTPFGGGSEHAECHGFPRGQHPAPRADCTCGLYGWYDPADSRIPLGGCTGPIFGVVQATGRVILGSHGFRAERLEVVAITAGDGPTRGLLRHLGYPVHDSREAMLAAYPPEDMSGLVGHQCDGQCVRRAADGTAVPISIETRAQDGIVWMRAHVAGFPSPWTELRRVASAVKAEADRVVAEAKETERARRAADPKTYALELRRSRGTGPGAPSLFRAALQRRGGGRG